MVYDVVGDETTMLNEVDNSPDGKVATLVPQQVFINKFLKNQQVIPNTSLSINSNIYSYGKNMKNFNAKMFIIEKKHYI